MPSLIIIVFYRIFTNLSWLCWLKIAKYLDGFDWSFIKIAIHYLIKLSPQPSESVSFQQNYFLIQFEYHCRHRRPIRSYGTTSIIICIIVENEFAGESQLSKESSIP